MAFGGSASSLTLPHTHNQSLTADGGALSKTLTDMGVDNLFSLITDSNKYELISSQTQAADNQTMTFSGLNLDMVDDYSYLFITFNGYKAEAGSSYLWAQINSVTSGYAYSGVTQTQSTTTIIGASTQQGLTFTPDVNIWIGANTNVSGTMKIIGQDDTNTGARAISAWSEFSRNNSVTTAKIYSMNTADILDVNNEITNIVIKTNAGTIGSGTIVTVYGVKRT